MTRPTDVVGSPGSGKSTSRTVRPPGPLKFDVASVDEEEYNHDLIGDGTVEVWVSLLEYEEKSRMRVWVTCVAISLWATSVVACILWLFFTGNALPSIAAGLLSLVLKPVLRFYYDSS